MVSILFINDMAFMPSEHKLNSETFGSVVSIQMFNDMAFMPSGQGSVRGSLEMWSPSRSSMIWLSCLLCKAQFGDHWSPARSTMFNFQSSIFNLRCSIFNVMAFLPSEHRLRSGTIGNVVSIQIFYYVAFMPSEQRLMTSPGSSPLL